MILKCIPPKCSKWALSRCYCCIFSIISLYSSFFQVLSLLPYCQTFSRMHESWSKHPTCWFLFEKGILKFLSGWHPGAWIDPIQAPGLNPGAWTHPFQAPGLPPGSHLMISFWGILRHFGGYLVKFQYFLCINHPFTTLCTSIHSHLLDILDVFDMLSHKFEFKSPFK